MSYKCEHGKDSDICVQCWEESNLEPPQQHVDERPITLDELNKNADLIGGKFVESELLPCPFCSHSGVLMETHKEHWIVRCLSDKCGARLQSPEFTPKEAWEKWNTRTESKQLIELQQQLSKSGIELLSAISEKAELFSQLEEAKSRLCRSPQGDDKIDELESAIEHYKHSLSASNELIEKLVSRLDLSRKCAGYTSECCCPSCKLIRLAHSQGCGVKGEK